MSGNSVTPAGVAGASLTATVAADMTTKAMAPTIPFLEVPVWVWHTEQYIAVLTVQNAVFITTAALSSIAVLITIISAIRKWGRT